VLHDLHLRAHVVVSGGKKARAKKRKKSQRTPKPWPDNALVWDTETTLDLEQKLNFGIWRFCELRDGVYVSLQEGIFHRDGLPTEDIQKVVRYAKNKLADGLVPGADRELVVLTRSEFVEQILWGSVRAGALVVGVNLPYDIARIAVGATPAVEGGFSFILSQLSRKGVENLHRPRVRIAPLNGVAEKIELMAVRYEAERHRWHRDYFLDLHTLAFALTDKSHSLESAIEAFGSDIKKQKHDPTGKISNAEIDYARQDVRATLGLLNALKREYELHPIHLPPYEAYSPASIGKAYLRAMGIQEPLVKFNNIRPRIHGIAMSAYFGGRAECRIRRWPVPVVPVDLTSEYPSVDALLGIWNILTAQQLEIVDVTEEVRKILKSVKLKRLFQPSFWRNLNFYASVIPDGEVVPVRAVYGTSGSTCNIGLNELHWKQKLWLAGPDLVSAVLNGKGRVPKVLKAFRIVPRGKQRGLKPIKLRGEILVDPRKEDFFTRVIEYRYQNKHNFYLEYFLKILANSTSYGAYLELNPVRVERRKRPKITIYSGELVKKQRAPDSIEQPGNFYFPLLGALITSGGRLLLAMIECCVRDAGGTYLCCDTDSLTIVARKEGGTVQMPGGTSINALSWETVDRITRRFDSLSPYNRRIVPDLLRLTKHNFDRNKIQRQLYGLSIAAKRYALYTTKCGQACSSHSNCVEIVDPKAHGLIFFAPSDEREKDLPKWWWELWRFLLALEFRQIKNPEFKVLMIGGKAVDASTAIAIDDQPKWISLPAMMKMRISTPHFMEQMKGKVSPYGFVLHPRTRENAKLTLLTPFNKNREMWANSLCVNTRDGKSYRLDEISRADLITLGDVLYGYIQHPEIKSLGPDGEKCSAETRGLLRRIRIKGGLHHPIGKEISRFEQGQDDFIENIDDAFIRYDGGRVAANESLKAEIRKLGLRKTTKETGLDRKTIRAVLGGKKVKVSTLAKVVNGLQSQ
jgi:hypothetical protein